MGGRQGFTEYPSLLLSFASYKPSVARIKRVDLNLFFLYCPGWSNSSFNQHINWCLVLALVAVSFPSGVPCAMNVCVCVCLCVLSKWILIVDL